MAAEYALSSWIRVADPGYEAVDIPGTVLSCKLFFLRVGPGSCNLVPAGT